MRLDELHLAKASDFSLCEDFNPDLQEKLANLRLMITRQGKDPDPIITRVRGMLDPEFARKEGFRLTIKKWVEGAQRGEEKVGKAYGRKVKITVLESALRQSITEGRILKGIGDLIVKGVNRIFGNDRQESQLVSKALENTPQLAALTRYANMATKEGKPVYDDPKFWGLVDKLTGGRAQEVKQLAHAIFKRVVEEAKFNGRGLLSECIMIEEKISDVMMSLGVPQEAAVDLISKYGLRDDPSVRPGESSAGWVEPEGEPGQAGQAKGAEAVVQPKQYDKYDVEEENAEFADLVILLTTALEQAKKAATPQEKVAAIQQVLPIAGPGVQPSARMPQAPGQAPGRAPAPRSTEVSAGELSNYNI